jgi:hypothetical protein
VHELADGREDGREDGGDGFVVLVEPGFELLEAADEFLVGAEHLAQLHEGAHDVDAHLDGGGAVEDVSSLDGTMLGEGVGSVAATAAASVV